MERPFMSSLTNLCHMLFWLLYGTLQCNLGMAMIVLPEEISVLPLYLVDLWTWLRFKTSSLIIWSRYV